MNDEGHGSLRRRVLAGACAIACLLAIAAAAERWLEARDEARLAGADTFADAGGARVRYRLAGADRPGAPVVFINGMAGSLEQWEFLQNEVSAFAPALAYDRGGLGFSHGSRAHDGAQQADELAEVLTALGIRRPVVVVGYSTSASIARIFASRHPSMTAGLLLLDPDLPEIEGRIPGRHNPFRTYFKPLLQDTVTSLFGLRRLASRISEWRGRFVLHTLAEERAHAVLLRFSHWWAVDREWMRVEDTSRQVREIGSLGSIPVLIYTGNLHFEGAANRLYLDLVRALAARTSHGDLRSFGEGTEHGKILEDPRTRTVIASGIRELAAAER